MKPVARVGIERGYQRQYHSGRNYKRKDRKRDGNLHNTNGTLFFLIGNIHMVQKFKGPKIYIVQILLLVLFPNFLGDSHMEDKYMYFSSFLHK